jgi:hypothetical protein
MWPTFGCLLYTEDILLSLGLRRMLVPRGMLRLRGVLAG